MTRKRRPFTPEFKQEATCLVLDQGFIQCCRSQPIFECRQERPQAVGRDESYVLIDQLSEQESVEMICKAFEVSRANIAVGAQ